MAISLASTTGGNVQSLSFSVDLPSPFATGDLLVVLLSSENGAAGMTAPSGWTYLNLGYTQNGGQAGLQVFYKISDGTETSPIAMTQSSGKRVAYVSSAFSGVDPSSPFDVFSYSNSGGTSVTSYTASSVTTTAANAYLIAAFASQNTSLGTVTPPSYDDILGSQMNNASVYAMGIQKATAGATGTVGISFSNSARAGGGIIALKAAPTAFTGTKTQPGKSRISKSHTKTQPGIGRISKTFGWTQSSSSRISKQLDISQYGVANISSKTLSADLIEITFLDGTVYSATQDSLSRIAKDMPLEQTGVARITRVVSADQPSTSRIQWIFNLTQDSISRIGVIGELYQTARAGIVNQVSKTQTGMAAIQWVLLLTQGSTARISKAVSFINTAKAQIAKEFSKTIIGRAWLAFIAEITQPSKASIQRVLERHQTSQAYIGTAYGNVEIGEDEIYAPIATVEQKQFTETTISSNNIYEVVEHDGI